LAVPVGCVEACDASDKVGKTSKSKNTGTSTTGGAKKTGYKQSRKEIADKVKAAMKKNDGLKDARAKIVDKLMFIINVNVILQLPLILYLIFFSWYKYPANQQNLLEDFE
jgi:hypothetical protein